MSEQCTFFGERDIITFVGGASFVGDLWYSTIPNMVTCFSSNNEQCYAVQWTALTKSVNK